MKDYWQNYIDGKFVDGGAGVIQVDNPGTGEKLADQAIADNADVDKAVSAAKKVHESGFLTNMRPVERARMVKKIGAYLIENLEEIAPLLSMEAGKTLFEAKFEVTNAARYFEYYGNQAETLEVVQYLLDQHTMILLPMNLTVYLLKSFLGISRWR